MENSTTGKYLKLAEMNGEEKIRKIRISSYEILCMMRDCTLEQKNDLIEKVRKSSSLEDFAAKSEVKKLAYPIEKMETAEYLLLNFKIDRGKIAKIKEVLKSPLIIRHMAINLDTEKMIKIKDSEKLQKNKKLRRPGFKTEKPFQGRLNKEIPQKDENHLEVNN